MTMQQFQQYLLDENLAFLLLQEGSNGLLPPNGRMASLTDLPDSITFPASSPPSLPNSVWRALGGFSRKVPKAEKKDDSWCPYQLGGEYEDRYCMRSFMRICNPETGGGIPYFEFMWGYFYNIAFGDQDLWVDSNCTSTVSLIQDCGKSPCASTCVSLRQGRFKYLINGGFTEELALQNQTNYNYMTFYSAVLEVQPSARNQPAKDFVMPPSVASQFGRTKLPGIVSNPYELLPEDPSCQFFPPANC
eukprot:TRINITY_DN44760_c0_g1_i1.p1 TRINITY_DN44760_c0_g1~~TRINITY_DN44760_c0_g1_i1.p1  ORF type:complete len:265 (-),score=44.18 TRINITY_DN44760_c0_g1_i1:260-1000(-)